MQGAAREAVVFVTNDRRECGDLIMYSSKHEIATSLCSSQSRWGEIGSPPWGKNCRHLIYIDQQLGICHGYCKNQNILGADLKINRCVYNFYE